MKKVIKLLFILLILAGIGYFAYSQLTLRLNLKVNLKVSQTLSPALGPDEQGQTANTAVATGNKNYTHPTLGLSLDYPDDWNMSSFDEGAGETLLFQKDGKGFQIYISEFSGGQITTSQVKKDIKDAENVTDFDIGDGQNGQKAVKFYSKDETGKKTLEIWWSRNGQLYQLTGDTEKEKEIIEIVKSIKWE